MEKPDTFQTQDGVTVTVTHAGEKDLTSVLTEYFSVFADNPVQFPEKGHKL
ncbi:MAG: hypothetical protein LBR72_02540 [Oscillospiraceae bacterium]|jgi:hypothetical protein|nr:hypothetical protein [Oscillospiraceae bacterium]